MKFRIAPQIKVHYVLCFKCCVFLRSFHYNNLTFEFKYDIFWNPFFFISTDLDNAYAPCFSPPGCCVLIAPRFLPMDRLFYLCERVNLLPSIYWFIYTLMSRLISLWSNASVSNMTRNNCFKRKTRVKVLD